MYKINKPNNTNNDTNNDTNTRQHPNEYVNGNKISNIIRNDKQYLQHQSLVNDIHKLHLLPPYCMTNSTRSSDNSYSDSNLPYKIKNVKNHRNFEEQTKIEYERFYKDWNSNVNYSSPNSNTYSNTNLDTNLDTNTVMNNYNTISCSNLENMFSSSKIYQETKRKDKFAKPMLINGSNRVQDIYNDCMNKPTFEFKRYSNINYRDKYWLDNPIYNGNISTETQDLYNTHMDNRQDNGINLYNSVLEDMEILGYNPSEDINIDNNTSKTSKTSKTSNTSNSSKSTRQSELYELNKNIKSSILINKLFV